MNLNALAEQDLSFTLEDTENGFAREFSLIDTSGNTHKLSGVVNDIGLTFDTEGNPISGRQITASFRLSKLATETGEYIRPGRGWKAEIVSDETGKTYTTYVIDFKPDRRLGLGLLILSLEFGNVGSTAGSTGITEES